LSYHQICQADNQLFLFEEASYWFVLGPPSNNVYETPLLDTYDNDLAMGLSQCYVERERLQLGEVITSGNFGDVWKGKLRQRDNIQINVAVKSLKSKMCCNKYIFC